MSYKATILADSVSPLGIRLTTLEVRFPRFLLAELNTHRTLSRNSASSRAIPTSKQASITLADPFIPEAWCSNQKGMQAGQKIVGWQSMAATAVWKALVLANVLGSNALAWLGVHKQWANRPLEPYAWQTAIVTATDWDNFLALRDNEQAQPEFQRLAHSISMSLEGSVPTYLDLAKWHLPLVPDFARLRAKYSSEQIARISCARCARVSYRTHDGRLDAEADLALAERLSSSGHMSPFEHVATPLPVDMRLGNFRGWRQYRKQLPHEENFGAFQKASKGNT